MRRVLVLLLSPAALTLMLLWSAIAAAQTPITGTLPPDAVTLLTALGLGKYIASIGSLLALAVLIISHLLPQIPPPSESAPGWWKALYQALSLIAGNYRYAANVRYVPSAEVAVVAAAPEKVADVIVPPPASVPPPIVTATPTPTPWARLDDQPKK